MMTKSHGVKCAQKKVLLFFYKNSNISDNIDHHVLRHVKRMGIGMQLNMFVQLHVVKCTCTFFVYAYITSFSLFPCIFYCLIVSFIFYILYSLIYNLL